jgi:hypothetical protein
MSGSIVPQNGRYKGPFSENFKLESCSLNRLSEIGFTIVEKAVGGLFQYPA